MKTNKKTGSTNRNYIIGAVLIALFLSAMDAMIMSVAMPTIVMELGGLNLYAWVYSGFSLASAVTLPITGKLADLYDTKKLFIASIGFFIITSVAAGLSNSMLFLVTARTLQGFGAGSNMALVYIVLSDVSTPTNRAKTLALGSFIWGISSVMGPSEGGFITTYMSWRWIFFINVPIGLMSLLCIALFFKETRQKKQVINLDIKGAVTLTGWVFCLLILILSGGEQFSWISAPSIILLFLTVIFLICFVTAEYHSPEPILSLSFFRQREFLLGNAAAFLSSFGVFSLFAYAALFSQGVMSEGPMEADYIMLTLSLGWAVGPILLTRFLHKTNTKIAIIMGALLLTAGSAYALTFGPSTTIKECVSAFVVTGFGMGYVTICTLLVVQK